MNTKTEQAKHTLGPWEAKISPHTGEHSVWLDEETCIAVCCDLLLYEDGTNESEANARRVVAAVNACEGISTEALEKGVVKELLEAAKAALAWHDDPTGLPSPSTDLFNAVAKAEGRKEPAPRKDSTWDEELTWESRPLEGEV